MTRAEKLKTYLDEQENVDRKGAAIGANGKTVNGTGKNKYAQ